MVSALNRLGRFYFATLIFIGIGSAHAGAGRTQSIGQLPLTSNVRADYSKIIQLPRLEAQDGHSKEVVSFAFSTNGSLLASGSRDTTIKLWDMDTGSLLRTFHTMRDKAGAVQSLVISPDGSVIVSGSRDRTLTFWSVATGEELRTLHVKKIVNSLVFSADGKSLITANDDGTLWLINQSTGAEGMSLSGHKGSVECLALSPDGKTLVSGSRDETLKLWDMATGRELRTMNGHVGRVMSVAFSPDGQSVISGGADHTVKQWDVATGKVLRTFNGHSSGVKNVSFLQDGVSVVSASVYGTLISWDAKSGRVLHKQISNEDPDLLSDLLKRQKTSEYDYLLNFPNSNIFSPNGKVFVLGGMNEAMIPVMDVLAGKVFMMLGGNSSGVNSVSFSTDAKTLVSGSQDGSMMLWNIASGNNRHLLFKSIKSIDDFSREINGISSGIASVAIAPNGNAFAGSLDNTIKIVDVSSGRELHTLQGQTNGGDRPNVIRSLAFSPDGRHLASGSGDFTVKLWDVRSGRELRTLSTHSSIVTSVAFSPDGRTVASGSWDKSIKLWDVTKGRELHTLIGHTNQVITVAFSPDGNLLASGSRDGGLNLWDVNTGKELRQFSGHSGCGGFPVSSVAFSPDGKNLAWVGYCLGIHIYDVATGDSVASSGHELFHWDTVNSVAFSPDGKILVTGSDDKTIKLWRVADTAPLATLTSFSDGSWVVTDPDGRYDSSNAGNNPYLHWVVGNTPIALDQLKDRYYEPGLLQKIMGFNSEPVRAVPKFADALAHLFPEVKAELDSAKPLQLIITLRDQGGGYGKVRVRLNGKEISQDARAGRVLNGATETLTLGIPPEMLLPAGNTVDVVAWNAEGHLSSPPALVKLDGARGLTRGDAQPGSEPAALPPTLHAIIMGVAHYANPDINLTFSGKDAYDFAQAITLGAQRMFGTDKVQLHLLSDYEDKAAPAGAARFTAQLPSRENLQNAFAQVAKESKPGDILVVFLAGHGVMSGGVDGDYHYLTRDAGGLDFSDPVVRKLWGVSSTELTEWIKQIRASKQMMVLDTCSSGGALQKLTQQRAVPSSQIIALDRLKDRTGFHVLAGAAADKSSLETSRFGQGVLTRALLTGMKGAALRDGEFVDVATLFQYARDEVPKLAKDIGGIQAPVVSAPRGESFDIGEMLEDDKKAVPLAKVREMMLRGVFQDEVRMNDTLKLSARFNQRLRAESQVAARGLLSFVDADEFPDAWSVAGRYQQTAQGVKVDVRMFHSNQPKGSIKLTLKGDEEQQVEQLFDAVMDKLVKESRK